MMGGALTVYVRLERERKLRTPGAIALLALLLVISGVPNLSAQNLPDFPDLPVPELLSRAPGSVEAGDGASRFPRLSPFGGAVVFESRAADFLTVDPDDVSDIYLLNRATGDLVLLTFPVVQVRGRKGDSFAPSVSRKGRRVVFWSESTVLSPLDIDPLPDVYIADLTAAGQPQIKLVSESRFGRLASGNGPSDQPEISADGRVVVFRSLAGNLTDPFFPEPFPFSHIHIALPDIPAIFRIAPTATTTANGPSEQPDVDGDGQHVVFMTQATDFLLEDQDQKPDVLLFRTTDVQFELLSRDPVTGEKMRGEARMPRIDGIGGRVVFEGRDAAFGAEVQQIFLHDLGGQTLRIISLDANGNPAAGACAMGDISFLGDCVVFSCEAPLTPDDTNGLPDTYIHHIDLGRTVLVSRSPATLLAGGTTILPLNGSVAQSLDDPDVKDVVFFSEFPLAPPGTADFNDVEDVYAIGIPPTDAKALVLPPSNHLHLAFDGIIARRDLDGQPNEATIKTDRFGGLGIDSDNVLWVLDGRQVSRYSAGEFQLLSTVEVDDDGDPHGLAAFGGTAYVGVASSVFHVTPDAEPGEPFRFAEAPLSMSLAGDPFGDAWVGARYDDRFELVRFAGDLVPRDTLVLPFPDDGSGRPYHELAVDAEGDLRLRSVLELAKLTHSGHIAWRRFLAPAGDGLAIDAFGNSYFVAGNEVGSLDPDGSLRFSIPVDLPLGQPGPGGRRIHLALDGNGDLWVLPQRSESVAKIASPAFDEETIGDRVQIVALGAPLAEQKSDVTGFSAANVTGRDADSDRDAYPNGREVARFDNPFDAAPPAVGRFPPVINLVASVVDGPAILLQWTSAIDFCEYEVTRNGRPLPGSPFDGEALRVDFDRFELRDQNPVGGGNRYTVVGIGECPGINMRAPLAPAAGDGGGAAVPDGGGAGPPDIPKSDPEDTSVTLGEGAVVNINEDIDALYAVDGTAVAVDGTKVFVAVRNTIVEFDINTVEVRLELADEIPLPQDPFESATITGLAVDPDDADMVFVLLRDGRFYHLEKGDTASPAVPLFDITAVPGNVRPGFDSYEYDGLAIRDGVCISVQNSVLFSISEPTVECLIGFRPSGPGAGELILRQTVDGEEGVLACRDTRWSGGVALLDPTVGDILLTGVGATGPAIDEIYGLAVSEGGGGALSVTLGNTALSIEVGLLGDVHDFGFSASEDLVVVAAEFGVVALIEATFPPAQQMDATPDAAKWDVPVDVQLDVSYGNTGKAFADLAFGVFVDGNEVTPDTTVVNGGDTAVALTLALNNASKRTRRVSVTVRSTEGSFTCEILLGFIRGDANNDGAIDVSDTIYLLLFLFAGGGAPACIDAANIDDSVNGDGVNSLNITDVMLLLNYLFRMGDAPPAPFGEFGIDKTVDDVIECTE